MSHHARTWRLPLRMLAIVLIAAAVPWPCLAAEPGQPAPRPRLQASITPIVKDVVARPASADRSAAVMKRAARQQSPTPDSSALEKKSFFKTGPGIAVIAALGAGAGYAIYSASHDRIHSTVPSGLQ